MGCEALAVLRTPGVLPAIQLFDRAVQTVLGSTRFGRDVADVADVLGNLCEPRALSAFARTVRSVVDRRGQVVTMLDRSYPVQVMWGEDDSVIPVSHAHLAHAAMPGSRLEIFKDCGHTPFHNQPDRFVEIVERFVDSTQPANLDRQRLRSLLQTGTGAAADPEPADAAPRGA